MNLFRALATVSGLTWTLTPGLAVGSHTVSAKVANSYDTALVIHEYDVWGDFPDRPWRPLTLLNALAIAQQAGPVSLDNIPVEPSLLNQLQNSMPVVKEKLRKDGHPPILTVMPQLRPLLARYARVFSPGLHVLSQNEIPDRVGVNILGTLG